MNLLTNPQLDKAAQEKETKGVAPPPMPYEHNIAAFIQLWDMGKKKLIGKIYNELPTFFRDFTAQRASSVDLKRL